MNTDQVFNLAIAHHQSGRLAEAEKTYRSILEESPRHSDAMHLLGVVSHQLGRSDAGIELIRQAIAINGNVPEYYCNLGLIFSDRGHLTEAVAQWRKAVARKPDYATALNYLGSALHRLGSLEEALVAYRRAVTAKPDFAVAFSNLGNLLRELNRMEEAVVACRRAISLRPDMAAAHNNLGNALNKLERLDEAVACYRKALELKSDYAETRSNLGNALKDLGRLDEAIASYRQALAMNPNLPECESNLVYDLHYRDEYDPLETLEQTRHWTTHHALFSSAPHRPHENNPDPDRPLRIGYVSPDFRLHSVSRFLLQLLRNHDRRQFEVFCYSDVRAPDATTELIRSYASQWRNMVGVDHAAAAELIRREQIDILIDLAGHTAQHRLLVFARKPAPVQITYLGYPGPTGVSQIDYRLTDAYADPPGQTESFYDEELIRLPRTAWCFNAPENSPLPDRSDVEATSSSLLRSTAIDLGSDVCFGSCNNFAKLTPRLLDRWADLLLAVPKSRLLVKAKALADPVCRDLFARRFINRGIDVCRLDLRGRLMDVSAHLAVYREIDIALDSSPYNGVTTTCEAMWMGVPVVTLAGSSHVSRVGVSLLSNVGLPELIAKTPEEYVAIAARLSADRRRLRDIRRTLRRRMMDSPLMDGPAFARDVESAYRHAWRRRCSKPPVE